MSVWSSERSGGRVGTEARVVAGSRLKAGEGEGDPAALESQSKQGGVREVREAPVPVPVPAALLRAALRGMCAHNGRRRAGTVRDAALE